MELQFEFKMVMTDGEVFTLKEVLIPHILAAIATNDYLLVGKIQSEYHQREIFIHR